MPRNLIRDINKAISLLPINVAHRRIIYAEDNGTIISYTEEGWSIAESAFAGNVELTANEVFIYARRDEIDEEILNALQSPPSAQGYNTHVAIREFRESRDRPAFGSQSREQEIIELLSEAIDFIERRSPGVALGRIADAGGLVRLLSVADAPGTPSHPTPLGWFIDNRN